MSTISDTPTELPVIPVRRDARCPLSPRPNSRSGVKSGASARDVPRQTDLGGEPLPRHQGGAGRSAPVRRHHSCRPHAVGLRRDRAGDVRTVDDPEHHRLRRMVTGSFTFRRAEAMRPQIQELVDQYLDEMIDVGAPADLVRHFALPVPSMVIALLLGVPPEDLELFQHHTARSDWTPSPPTTRRRWPSGQCTPTSRNWWPQRARTR